MDRLKLTFMVITELLLYSVHNGMTACIWMISIAVDPTVCASDVRIKISDEFLEIIPYFPNWV